MVPFLEPGFGPITYKETESYHNQCSHKALRQQFGCSQSASVGICVEDITDQPEDDGHNTDKCHKKASWKDRCKYSSDKDGAGHKQGERTEPYNFWRLVQGPGPVVEAIGVGGVIALGIQLSHFKCLHRKARAAEDHKKHCLLYKVAYALPILQQVTTRQNISQTHSQTQTKQPAEQPEAKPPEVETLDEAFVRFEDLCLKYTAVGKGIMGHQAAAAGNLATAASLWAESSDLGHTKAQFNLAVCYETGHGVKKDMTEALKYYQMAAEGDHQQALYNLALLYLEGGSDVPKDTDQGVTLLTRAADQGMVHAQRLLGVHFTEEGSEDIQRALKYISMAAQQQDDESQYNLGQCYEHGVGVKQDFCQAASLYSQAADSGHIDAMYSLALFHLHGQGGLPQDQHSAVVMFQKAADQGHEEARQELERLTQHDQSVSGSSDRHHTYLLRLNSSVSTPCLTDYLRGNIVTVGSDTLYDPVSDQGTLSQIYTQLVSPRAVTQLPSLTHISQSTKKKSKTAKPISRSDSDSDSGVVFSLGFEEMSLEASATHLSDSVLALTDENFPRCSSPALRVSMQRRTATMPELLHVCI